MRNCAFLLFCAFCMAGCNGDEDAKAAWNAVIKKCAVSDLNTPTILYFGPSNNVGPGSVWRADAEGGYHLRFTVADIPDPKNFITKGNSTSCEGTSSTKFGLKASAGLTTSVTPVSLNLSNDLQKAKSIEVKVTSASWDLISEVPYETRIKALPATNNLRQDLDKGDRLVIGRALRISGYSAVLTFSDSDTAGLKAKYSGTLAKALTGDVGAELSANWSADNKLTLTSAGDFYIAGELTPYKAGGFAAANVSPFGPARDIGNVKALDRENVD